MKEKVYVIVLIKESRTSQSSIRLNSIILRHHLKTGSGIHIAMYATSCSFRGDNEGVICNGDVTSTVAPGVDCV